MYAYIITDLITEEGTKSSSRTFIYIRNLNLVSQHLELISSIRIVQIEEYRFIPSSLLIIIRGFSFINAIFIPGHHNTAIVVGQVTAGVERSANLGNNNCYLNVWKYLKIFFQYSPILGNVVEVVTGFIHVHDYFSLNAEANIDIKMRCFFFNCYQLTDTFRKSANSI